MTTYKDIRGTHIVTVASDPPAPANGQVWYNSTDQVMKGLTANPAGAWASGGNVNTARRTAAGVGTQTAALIAGGYAPGAVTGNTEIYDGSSWTETTDMSNSRRFLGGDGTLQAAVGFGVMLQVMLLTQKNLITQF